MKKFNEIVAYWIDQGCSTVQAVEKAMKSCDNSDHLKGPIKAMSFDGIRPWRTNPNNPNEQSFAE